jgi:hypothetical protein
MYIFKIGIQTTASAGFEFLVGANHTYEKLQMVNCAHSAFTCGQRMLARTFHLAGTTTIVFPLFPGMDRYLSREIKYEDNDGI